MEPTDRRRLFQLFDALCDAPPVEQQAVLQGLTDDRLRSTLKSMLAADAARSAARARPRHRRPPRRRRTSPFAAAAVVAVMLGVVGSALTTESAREAAAARHLSAAESEVRRLEDLGRLSEADAVFSAFARLPEHAGTRALVSGWLNRARRLTRSGDFGARRVAAAAWVAAERRDDRADAAVLLAETLRWEGRWGALVRLGDAMEDDAPSDLSEPVFEGLVAVRHPTAPSHAPPSRHGDVPLVRALGTGQLLARDVTGAALIDLDGPAVVISRDDALTIQQDGTSVTLPDPPEHFVFPDRLQAFDGTWILAAQGEDATALFRREGDAWTPWHSLPPGLPQRLHVHGDDLWVALSYPERDLFRVSSSAPPERVYAELELLDSDVMDVVVADLDGDGTTERAIALGAWGAYDVRVENGRDTGRLKLGVVEGLAFRDGVFVASKADHSPSAQLLGASTPTGRPAGLYVLQWDGTLSVARHLPPPFDLATAPGDVYLGDIDGDGALDAVVELLDHDAIWVVRDIEGEAASLLVAGWSCGGLADLDGDGDSEVLVTSTRGDVWVLGSGDTPVPTWTDPTVVDAVPDILTDLPVWDGARALLHLGLPDEAAASLARTAIVQTDPQLQVTALLAASELEASLGDLDAAASRHARVLELAEEGSPDRRRALAQLAETRARSLDFDGAHTTWSWLSPAEREASQHLGWLPDVTAVPSTDVLAAGPLDERLRVADPGALRRSATDRSWGLDLFNDSGDVLSGDVLLSGDRLGLELALTVTQAELGAGVAARIESDDGATELLAELYTTGGAGRSELAMRCGGPTKAAELQGFALPSEPVPVSLHVERVEALGEIVCRARVGDTARAQRITETRPIPSEPRRLRVTSAGHPGYNPPTRLQAQLRHLRVHGAQLAEGPATEPGARALVEGSPHDALSSEDPDVRLWASLMLGRFEGPWPDDPATLSWILRRYPERGGTTLADALGDDFPALFRRAWHEAWRFATYDDVHRALRLPVLERWSPRTPDALAIQLGRARVAHSTGDDALATELASTAISTEADHTDPDVRATLAELNLLLAETHAARDRREDAIAAIGRYLSHAPTREYGLDRVRARETLRPLVDALEAGQPTSTLPEATEHAGG